MMFVCPECGESFQGPGTCLRDRAPLIDGAGDALLGQTVGPYRVACRIGAGGMGQVYKGVHPAIGSRVAIKVLSGDFSRNQTVVERFFSEARSVNVIRHESIVNVLDLAWLPDGRPYIVMEFLDGQPLSSVIRQRGTLPLGSLLTLVAEVLDALTAAHAQGIVHRDLKPDNIFVTQSGRAKVLDFGVAKLRPELGGGSDATATGSILGTPHYMSPEQAQGRGVDLRADLYSLGVILFQGATGRLPFEGASLYELLKQHIEVRPPPVRALRPDLPPAFEQTVARALEKEPARRFGSAAELAAALAAVAEQVPRESFVSLGARAAGASGASAGSWGDRSADHAASSASLASGFGEFSSAGGGTGYTTGGAGAVSGVSLQGSVATHAGSPARRGGSGLLWLALLAGVLVVVGVLGVAVVTIGAVGAGLLRGQGTASPGAGATGTERGRLTTADDDPLTNPLSRPGPIEWMWQKPKGFDPKRLDADAHLEQGFAFAQKSMPDAELLGLNVSGANREGLVDLSLTDSSSGAIMGRWRSPKLSARPAELPVGAKLKAKCVYLYMVGDMGILAMAQDQSGCEEPTLPAPTCTIKQVLAKADAKGAPTGNYIANLMYLRFGSLGVQWRVEIGDFDVMVPDDCR